jgi:ATP-dependent DNA helicase
VSAPVLLGGGAPSASDGSADGKPDKKNQLDFLLNKASEYSQFIAGDLKDLQEQMAMKAAMEAEEGTKGKKRTKGSGSAPNKAGPGAQKPIFTQPKVLTKGCVLKDYQLEGVRWLASLYENGVSGILADEMGLGKTIQVIGLVAHLMTVNVLGPFMVVAPLATLPNWVREFEKWLPGLPVVRYHGSQAERNAFWDTKDADGLNVAPLQKRNRKDPRFPVIITSYEVAIRDMKKLSTLAPFQYMIVDEGQRLKNRKCCLIRNLKQIKADNRLLLSGTPIQNNLDELWSLLNFVNPQIFDDLNVFQSWFGFKDIGGNSADATSEESILATENQNNIVSKLHEILRPFLLRRVKMDVLKEMPPKKEIVVYAGMSQLQRGYSHNIDKGILREELMKSGIEGANMVSQINTLMNHRKNSNHPFLFGEPIDPGTGKHVGTAFPALLIRASGKFNLLDRMLTKLHKNKHQVLIFSQMTEVLSIIEDYLVYRQWKYCRIDGSTKIDDRQRQMDLFNAEKTNGTNGERNDNDDRHFVFLLSTRAGGLGINLASADTCIIFDSDWNPHQDSQAMDRCHRIGQTRPVAVYRLLTAGSVDMDMMEKQISKKKLDRMTIAGGDFRKGGQRSKGAALSNSHLADLLADDIANLKEKTDNIEDVKITEDELNNIMDREMLFPNFIPGKGAGPTKLPMEGKMYDIIENKEVDSLKGFDGAGGGGDTKPAEAKAE